MIPETDIERHSRLRDNRDDIPHSLKCGGTAGDIPRKYHQVRLLKAQNLPYALKGSVRLRVTLDIMNIRELDDLELPRFVEFQIPRSAVNRESEAGKQYDWQEDDYNEFFNPSDF